jgi:AcrR family transcriptional regulator
MTGRRPPPVRKRPRQERAHATFDALIIAAERVLQQEGAARLTTNRIAHVAGVSVGSVYQYFPDKQAIVAALGERYMQHYVEAFEALLAVSMAEPVERIVATILRGLNLMRRDQGANVHRALQDEMSSAMLRVHNERVLTRYAESLDRYLVARPDLAPHRTPLAAHVVVYAAAGVMRAWATAEHTAEEDEALIREGVRLLAPFLAGR